LQVWLEPFGHLSRAQQSAIPAIGFMSTRTSEDSAQALSAFRQGLTEAGFVEGRTVAIQFRWARGDYDRLPELAADLVGLRVAVLVAVGGDASALAATKAARTIPIVFGVGGDPVKAGFVTSFNRPSGNATGYTLWTNEMEAKRLGLLRELVPAVPLIGVLLNTRGLSAAQELEDLELAAKGMNQRLLVVPANSGAELDTAFVALARQRVGALLVTASSFFDTPSRPYCRVRSSTSITCYLSVS
jgi:putative ABC transport system substrate-binding protein